MYIEYEFPLGKVDVTYFTRLYALSLHVLS